jgi:hypothetical protein
MEGSPSNTREERRLVEEEEGFETQYLFASLHMQHNPPASVSHVREKKGGMFPNSNSSQNKI